MSAKSEGSGDIPRTVQAVPKTRQICRHCQKRLANRPRGLCWGCYYRPGVLEHYPSTSKYGSRGVGISGKFTTPTEPPTPTKAHPGTLEKMLVLAEMAAAGQPLFVAGDETRVLPIKANEAQADSRDSVHGDGPA